MPAAITAVDRGSSPPYVEMLDDATRIQIFQLCRQLEAARALMKLRASPPPPPPLIEGRTELAMTAEVAVDSVTG